MDRLYDMLKRNDTSIKPDTDTDTDTSIKPSGGGGGDDWNIVDESKSKSQSDPSYFTMIGTSSTQNIVVDIINTKLNTITDKMDLILTKLDKLEAKMEIIEQSNDALCNVSDNLVFNNVDIKKLLHTNVSTMDYKVYDTTQIYNNSLLNYNSKKVGLGMIKPIHNQPLDGRFKYSNDFGS
jgi:hypothetical protein